MKKAAVFSFLALFLALGCSNEPGGVRPCLMGDGFCDDDIQKEVEVDPKTVVTCDVIPSSTMVRNLEAIRLDVTVTGGTPPYNILNKLPDSQGGSFLNKISIYGIYENTKNSDEVVTKTISVEDSSGRIGRCSFSVVVTHENSPSLSCSIIPSTHNPVLNMPVIFKLKGVGGDGSYLFSSFSPGVGQTLNSNIIKKSANEAEVSFIYTTKGVRMASVLVASGGKSAICRVPIFVDVPIPEEFDSEWDWRFIPPWWWLSENHDWIPGIPLACNIKLSPNHGITGTLSEIQVSLMDSIKDQFEISDIEFKHASNSHVARIINGSGLARNVQFLRSGEYLVKATVRKRTNSHVKVSCSTFYYSKPQTAFITSPAYIANPEAKIFQVLGWTYASFPIRADKGASVAICDINRDGVTDVITSSKVVAIYDGKNLNRVLKEFDPVLGSDSYVACGDVDADTYSDIVVSEKKGSSFKVYSGKTILSSPTIIKTIQPYGGSFSGSIRVALGDINGDGYSEIIVPTFDGRGIIIFSSKNWQPVIKNILSSDYINSIAVGDINSDGFADLGIVTNNTLKVINGVDFSTYFSMKKPFINFYGNIEIAIGDINADGKGDLIVATGEGDYYYFRSSEVKIYNIFSNRIELDNLFPYPYTSSYRNGIFIAAGTGGL